jgi:toxin ParE1/3/4
MKKYRIAFLPRAEADLRALFDYIAAESSIDIADAYARRIEAACRSLETFPMRGIRRDDFWPGLRIMGFERRVAIAFTVLDQDVEIVRILYGGRDYGHILAPRDG